MSKRSHETDSDEPELKRCRLENMNSPSRLVTEEDLLVLTDEQVLQLISEKDEILEHAGIILQDLIVPRANITTEMNQIFEEYKSIDITNPNLNSLLSCDVLDLDSRRYCLERKDIDLAQYFTN